MGVYTPATPTPLPSADILSSILDRLNSVDMKLSHFDQIHQTVTGLVSRIDKIEQRINNFKSRIKDLDKSCDFSDSPFGNLKKQTEDDSILKSTNNLQSRKCSVDLNNSKLQAEITDLKCRSMRKNVLFFQIPEEECDRKILDFI
ncbi:hypothetical protein DPMN_181896 [Dreissena polymorpha]|uniref:Uncharacterized protein n=1 Tax=Dreissena polymorpha TaxID=45954 RepID=A0A9D4DH25_DREPO|nr:hypothetical protein DPMN_181896 [Dreissena polymorpha]